MESKARFYYDENGFYCCAWDGTEVNWDQSTNPYILPTYKYTEIPCYDARQYFNEQTQKWSDPQ